MADDSELHESPQTRVEWKIKNFWNLPKENEYLFKSPSFFLSKVKWHLEIYSNRGYIFFTLRKEETTTKLHVVFKIEIRQTDGSMVVLSEEIENIFGGIPDGRGSYFNISALLGSTNTIAWNSTLTLVCSIRIVDKLLVTPTTESASPTQFSKAATMEVASQISLSEDILNLSRDLKELYLRKSFTDVTIKVKNKEFSAHINILAARSAVFASMFHHDTEEKKSGRIEIPDCDPDTFEYFLLFLYSGNFNDVTSSNAVNLYEISDKYDVQELKEKCVRLMTDTLTPDSFCDVLHLASMHNEFQLLKTASDFFSNNTREIMISQKWHAFISENPLLCNELLLKCFTK